MAPTKVAVLVTIICFLLQCAHSQSILAKLRVNDLPKGKHGWTLGLNNRLSDNAIGKKIRIPAVDLSDLEGNIVVPTFEFGKLKLKNRKPIFSGKLGKRASLKGKLSNLAKRKSSFVKGKLANIKPIFSKGKLDLKAKFGNKLKLKKIRSGKFSKSLGIKDGKIKNRLGSVFGRRLLAAPKLTLDGKLTSQKLNLSNAMLGSKGLKLNTNFGNPGVFKNTLRQRLADKLGLGSRFQFFDGRHGIFDRSNRIFDLKKVNPLDMLDGKLAKLNARFGKAIDRIHNKFSKKIGRLDLSPVDASILKQRLDKALDKVDLEIPGVNGTLGKAVSRVDGKVAGINGKVEDIVGAKRAFVDSKLAHIKDAVDSNLPLLKSASAKPRSLLGGLRIGRSRFGGGLKIRNGLNVRSGLKLGRSKGLKIGSGLRLGGGLKLGGGLRFGRSKLSLNRPKLSFRRFRRIGGPKIDSRSAAAIANVIVAGINGVAPVTYSNGGYDSYSGESYRSHARRLRSEPRKTLFQRLSLKNGSKPRLSFSDRLAQKISQKLGSKLGDRLTLKFKSPKSGRLSAFFAGKLGKSDGSVSKIAQLPLFNRKFGDKFGKLTSFDGKLANAKQFDGKFKKLSRKSLKSKVFDKSEKFPGFDMKHVSPTSAPSVRPSTARFSTKAPSAVSTTTVPPTTQVTTFSAVSSVSSTASAASEVASTAMPAGLADAVSALGGQPDDASLFLSGMEHDDSSGVPGTDGVLFAIELLESGGTVGEATQALIQLNDMSALKTLMDAVKQAAMRR